jgi:cobalamin biosynthesis Mg chelatase CobN
LAEFPAVVESTRNLASDAAGVAAHMAPEAADTGTPAPDLAPANVGEVVETRPQVDANAPLQLIREICNRVSYPCASKSSSRANPGVAEKHSTPARARQAVAQGKGVARKKATQGGESRMGSQSSPTRIGRKSDSRKRHRSSSHSSSSRSSSSTDSSVVSVDFFCFEIALVIFFCVVINYNNFFLDLKFISDLINFFR